MYMGAEEKIASDVGWALEGLASGGPLPELKEQLALFGQFVGDWDILENRSLQKDGTWSRSRGALHWRWVLEGRALQDIWTSFDAKSGKEIVWGTTIRFYDPKIDAWRSTWISPRQGVVRTFVGRTAGREIVLEGSDPEGRPEKWVFFEIMPDSFKWRAEASNDGGRTFVLEEVMLIRRSPKK